MDKIRQMLEKPMLTAIAGFVLGLLIGLPILGWWIWPVQWTDAAPAHLRQDVKADYLRMAIESYSINQDQVMAQQRWQELGPGAQNVLDSLKKDSRVDQKDLAKFNSALSGKPVAVTPKSTQADQAAEKTKTPKATSTLEPGKPTPTESTEKMLEKLLTGTPPASGTTQQTPKSNVLYIVLGVLCVLTLLVAGVLVYMFFFRKKTGPKQPTLVQQEQEANKFVEKTDFAAEGHEQPISQFMSTYMLGDDLYDDSFSIDSASGEFLGECGVGISDTVGVGDPKKVAAFEVWLFDKNDIQTVTKVFMSEYAYNDPTIRQRLASKGEPVLVAADKRIVLETATLQLEARVVDMNYGSGALPQNSFFERVTLELAVWPKHPAQ
jgi:hypothetical protein